MRKLLAAEMEARTALASSSALRWPTLTLVEGKATRPGEDAEDAPPSSRVTRPFRGRSLPGIAAGPSRDPGL